MTDSRLLKLKKILKENTLDAALISSLPNIIHLTNFSYFTDIEREAFLLITKTNQYLFTDGRYSHAVKKFIKDFELRELQADKSLTYHLKQIFDEEKIFMLGIDEDNLTVREQKQIATIIQNQKHFTLHSLRVQKNVEEIAKIKKACLIGDKAFTYILKQIKIGMSEKEIAFLLETFMKKNHVEPSFPSIVAFQENAAVPHHKTGKKKLKMNQFILLDFGVKYQNYCSDMTRTIFFGKANKEQKKAYQTVLKAQQSAIERFNHLAISSTTVKASELDKAARSYIVSQDYPSFPHSLGHGIGLQVHEAPRLSPVSQDSLTEGMVFSIEPGIYVNDKFGIRIEDLFTIQNGNLIQLTKSPQKFIQL